MDTLQTTDIQDENNHPPAVAGVMVTYRIGEGVRPAIEAALPEVGHLFIVDNGGDAATKSALEAAEARHPGKITLLFQADNNFAHAQNRGITAARDAKYHWILLLDHDSTPQPGMVYQLLGAWRQHPRRREIGLVAPYLQLISSTRAPCYPQFMGKFGFRMARFGKDPLIENVMNVIGSGSLIRTEVFAETGLMDSELGLDYVDKDFCLRLYHAGYRILAVKNALLVHQLGAMRDHALCGVRLTASHHGADRRYSITRNRILTMRRFATEFPAFCLYESLGLGYDVLRILLCEADKKVKLRQMLRGFRDGLVMKLERHVPA